MDLSEFLLARIAEDQRAAQAEWDWMVERHGADFWTTGEGAVVETEWEYETDRDATLHVSPRRVLAECDAKRRIVELAEGPINDLTWVAVGADTTDPGDTDVDQQVLRLLALPYANHPDYDPEWKV